MAAIHVGTSGWSYPSGRGTWNGVFYPAPRPRGFDELAWYADHFDTVEVNSTFYRQPEPAMSQAWARRTPATFLFAVKLFQKFTHPDMYLARDGVRDWDLSLADVEVFRRGVAPLADAGRLAALLVQFPPSFHAMPETLGYLDWLLAALPGYPLAVELRHRTWSDDARTTAGVLAAHDAAWVWIDEPKFRQSIRQSPDLDGARSLAYVRLHGRNAAEWWSHGAAEDRYDYLYSREELAPVAGAASAAAHGDRRVLIYLNNHFSAKSVANAAVLKHDLGQLVPGEYLPAMVERYPALAGIVPTSRLPL